MQGISFGRFYRFAKTFVDVFFACSKFEQLAIDILNECNRENPVRAEALVFSSVRFFKGSSVKSILEVSCRDFQTYFLTSIHQLLLPAR
jgi:hypothetical protein